MTSKSSVKFRLDLQKSGMTPDVVVREGDGGLVVCLVLAVDEGPTVSIGFHSPEQVRVFQTALCEVLDEFDATNQILRKVEPSS